MKLELNLILEPATVHRPEELTARGTFTNAGEDVLNLNLQAVSSPSLALEVRRAGGEVVRMFPPPVPFPGDDVRNRLSIAPGESRTFVYENFLPQSLAPGDYEICLRYSDGETMPESPWLSFKIA